MMMVSLFLRHVITDEGLKLADNASLKSLSTIAPANDNFENLSLALKSQPSPRIEVEALNGSHSSPHKYLKTGPINGSSNSQFALNGNSNGYGSGNGKANGSGNTVETRLTISHSGDVKSDSHILKETTSLSIVRAKKELAAKITDNILVGVPTCHDFLDFIATERLRSMPHRGSKWDKILKWAESYARAVERFSLEVAEIMPHTWESAKIVWGCCKLLLSVCQ